MRYFKRRWEDSRGDEYDSWGPAVYYFEVGDDGQPIRQVEVYDHGPTLRYGPGHDEDQYGFLGQANLDKLESLGLREIPAAEFEQVWA